MLPSLEAARVLEPDLPDPASVRALAGLTIAARFQRRDVRTAELEVSEARLSAMLREPPPPPEGFVHETHVVLGQLLELRRCTLCAVRPGTVPCPFCSLAGCEECAGSGWRSCTACDGNQEIAMVEARYVEDREIPLRITFTPNVSPAVDAVLRTAIDDTTDPPDEYRFELDRSAVFAPYRESGEIEAESFQGFSFEDAIERARAGLFGIRKSGEVVREELRAWARPFLVLSFREAPQLLVIGDGASVRLLRP